MPCIPFVCVIHGSANKREGKLCFSRRFQSPTNLEPGETVWLEVSARGNGEAKLNGQFLGTWSSSKDADPATAIWPIKMLLLPSNTIELFCISTTDLIDRIDRCVPGNLVSNVQLIILLPTRTAPFVICR